MAQRLGKPLMSIRASSIPRPSDELHVEPDITMEIFFVDRPLDGFGAVEVMRPD
jgi:hypothetical protein